MAISGVEVYETVKGIFVIIKPPTVLTAAWVLAVQSPTKMEHVEPYVLLMVAVRIL